jgi:hydroxymethylpyrimidine pyrophosphatase-like HAD family hydrolase
MLYKVSELSALTNLSKVSIYKKLKLKEFEPYISKNAGTIYIDEIGFNLLKDSLKLKEIIKTDFTNRAIQTTVNEEISIDTAVLTINKELVKTLVDQLKEKDLQIHELNKRLSQEQDLHQNTQILLTAEQNRPKQDLLQLEEHFKEIDNRLLNIRVEMNQKQEEKPKQRVSTRIK